ncbi:MAG: ribosome silencing factor [Halobacteriovorax sp.]|nr:ribosome silencing factor [Halobacteriovorax sp.]|tara:strand:+ start:79348 stop:79809 length:462 start_codon:yes stop_codon:yes gene_type:complete
MSAEYIKTEVDKIVEDKSFPYPQNIAMAAAWIMGNFKGLNLKVLDTTKRSSLADFFIMGSANNMTQAKSMADEIVVQLKRHNVKVLSKEGLGGSEWILIDLGDIIVHVFLDNTRTTYNLDELWQDAPQIKIPNEYYFEEPTESDEETGGRNFF